MNFRTPAVCELKVFLQRVNFRVSFDCPLPLPLHATTTTPAITNHNHDNDTDLQLNDDGADDYACNYNLRLRLDGEDKCCFSDYCRYNCYYYATLLLPQIIFVSKSPGVCRMSPSEQPDSRDFSMTSAKVMS